MSYADVILRRRQEAEDAWKKRYNPAEDVLSTLSAIDKTLYERAGTDAERKRAEEQAARDVEMFGLKKTQVQAETDKAKAEAARGNEERIALAKKHEAETAAALAEERRKAEAAALTGGAQDIYGRLSAKGQTMKDVFAGSQAAARAEEAKASRQRNSQRLDDAMARGDSAEVARLRKQIDAETKAVLSEKPVTASGYTEADIQEMADAHGVLYGTMLAELLRMDAENAASREAMGLTTQKSETEKARQTQLKAAADAQRALAARYGRQGFPKPEKSPTVDPVKERKALADALYAEEKLRRIKLATGNAGSFALTESQRSDLQKRRTSVIDRSVSSKNIKDLIKKYPGIEKYVGPIDQYISVARGMFGDKAASEISTALGKAFDEYRIAVTGAAAGPTELRMLEGRTPRMGDSLSQILGKLAVDEDYFKNKLSIIDAQIQSNDIRGADKILGIESGVDTSSVPAGISSSGAAEEEPMSREEADQYFEETP